MIRRRMRELDKQKERAEKDQRMMQFLGMDGFEETKNQPPLYGLSKQQILLRLKREIQVIQPIVGQRSTSGRLPKDIWNYFLFAFLDMQTLLTLERVSRYFNYRLSASPQFCQCNEGTGQGDACRSVWAVAAIRERFISIRYGDDLACAIVKKVARRQPLEKEVVPKLKQLYQLQCDQGKHIWKKKLRKRGQPRECELCNTDLDTYAATVTKPTCGIANPRKFTYCDIHEYLCEYSN